MTFLPSPSNYWQWDGHYEHSFHITSRNLIHCKYENIDKGSFKTIKLKNGTLYCVFLQDGSNTPYRLIHQTSDLILVINISCIFEKYFPVHVGELYRSMHKCSLSNCLWLNCYFSLKSEKQPQIPLSHTKNPITSGFLLQWEMGTIGTCIYQLHFSHNIYMTSEWTLIFITGSVRCCDACWIWTLLKDFLQSGNNMQRWFCSLYCAKCNTGKAVSEGASPERGGYTETVRDNAMHNNITSVSV